MKAESAQRKPTVVVVDHGTGNLASASRALAHVGANVERSFDRAVIDAADAVVLPGVGAFPRAMENMQRLGLDTAVRDAASAGRPVLGVCLGAQMLLDGSEELGGSEGLGLIPGRVSEIDAAGGRLPHIGWASVRWEQEHPVTAHVPDGSPMYHVHSFAAVPELESDVLGTAIHGKRFVTAVVRGTVVGVQFHPEKSSGDGLALLRGFVEWAARA